MSMGADVIHNPSAGGEPAHGALDALADALAPGARRGVPLARFTAMRVGGPAALLVLVESLDQLADAVEMAREHGLPWRVLGSGCNVLVADRGLEGLVIVNRADAVAIEGQTVRAASGVRMPLLVRRTVDACLAGLTWAAGLPGTVGGAVVGNAGAFDGDMAGSLQSAAVLEANGEIVERPNAWFDFAYRTSRLKRERQRERVVLEATFQLEPGDEEVLRNRADEVVAWRRAHHPSHATMGSTFKNPPGGYAGELIEEAGLKGYRIGGAQVSEQHANFLVNTGDAAAGDVLALIRHIQAEVERQFGVQLALEIELLGWS
jgi:UDP-N-acetylmuramate dehydrogenase